MDAFMKKEILDHLPSPTEIEIPDYLERTITEEVKNSGLSPSEIEQGGLLLKEFYSQLKSGLPTAPNYSEQNVYIAYIETYLRMYYPRMYLVMNQLIRYTQFFEVLKEYNGETIKILDIGAGPGTMFMALINYLEYINQLGAFDFEYEVSLIEQEVNFLNFLNCLFNNINDLSPRLNEKLTLNGSLEAQSINFENLDGCLNSLFGNETFKVIILSFILNENVPEKDKIIKLFKILARYLDQNGIIILFEAPSDHLFRYLEFDFQENVGLFRIAPCLNGNSIYGIPERRNLPFFKPCGDLCTFQVNPSERNRFCYLILSKNNIISRCYEDSIQNTIDFYKKYRNLTFLPTRQKRKNKLNEIGREIVDIIGLFSDRRNYDYYFCNGGCKFKIDNYRGSDFNFEEGDLVLFRNVKFDGPFVKINYASQPPIIKNYAELAFKYGENRSNEEPSSFEVIPYFL